jgi:hypothetical protein
MIWNSELKMKKMFLAMVVLLVAVGCGSDASDETGSTGGVAGDGGTGGMAGSPGAGGTGGMAGTGGDTELCERICGSSCAGELIDPGEIATCVQDCTMGGTPLDDCLPETAAVLDCIERYSCEVDVECLDDFTTLEDCVGL